ncbi:Rrf2 family transcriptional regulator [Oribacterium sp. oral taxon 102]|uniref:RrF2 family transcriptional regulator n=1 Tax=Oribacterium sp. oral taxon 102 TaxID=671214 RepID=UPI0015BF38EB|nr:Rrf2 family transcriptional regulator [Oribacterium sp. oral taxon 102]NWO20970.1 Rrf2 family transcriptional regulator [Oribacterium sp. oral taxon 102]
MMISTKGRYALTIMIDIAAHEHDGSPISIKDISERQGLSVKYLEQIISLMVKGGFLRSVRGAKGGYLLTRSADILSVGDILDAAEGTLAPVDCLKDGNRCQKSASCPTFPLYKEIDDAIYSVVNRYRLSDLVQMNRNVEELENNFGAGI